MLVTRGRTKRVRVRSVQGNTQHLTSQDSNIQWPWEYIFSCLGCTRGLQDEELVQNIRPAAMFAAVLSGDLESVRCFVRLGLEVDTMDKHGRTPLHVAAQYGQVDMVEFLISAGADVESVDKAMMSPLLVAAIEGNVDVLKILLQRGADANESAQGGYTPLHLVLRHAPNPAEVAMVLIDSGADPRAINKYMENPLHCACYNPDGAKAINLMLKFDNAINSRAKFGVTPLHIAAANSTRTSIIQLIRSGADIEAVTQDGITAIHFASQSLCLGRCEVMAELLANTVSATAISTPDNNGSTPLHYAAHSGQETVLEMLLDHGADINAVDKHGCTALHVACKSQSPGRRMVVEHLLSRGLSPTATDNNSMTALHHAAMAGSSGLLDEMLRRGHPHELPCSRGARALHLAADGGHIKCLDLLIDASPDSIDCTDDDGRTALHYACNSGKAEAAEFLLAKGASAFPLDRRMESPLHLAAVHRDAACLNAVADRCSVEELNAPNGDGHAALHLAVLSESFDAVHQLLKRGCNRFLVNKDGQTPQQLAQQTGHPSIIRLVETNDFIKWKSVDFNEVVRSASAMSLNESNWEATCSLPGMFDNSSRGGETLHDAPSSSSGAEARLLLPEVLPGRNARKHPQLPEVPPAHMVGSKLSTSPEAAHAACLASSAKENKPPQQALDGLHQQQDPGSRQTPDSMRQSSLADLPGGDGRVRFDSRVAQHRADGETSPLRRASDGCGVEDHKHYMASSNAKKHAVSFSREIGQPPPDGRSDFHEYEAQDFVPETSCLFDLSHESSNFPPVQFEAPDELMENSLRHQQSNSSCPSVPSRVDGNSSPESSQREPERAGTSRYHTEELGVQHGTLEAKDCGAQLPQEANNQMHDRPSSSADLSEERQEEKLSGQPLIEVPLLQPELIPD